ncbi:related to AMFR protein [Ramularia collo-cygni]|uniref:Related to AMFR protein n=1 Tax=Ramularia collo-cygni TaxID=112498 RepID=A0A2D3UWY8_9PEZI|nr:related to AMFR protein [Ramularia collo-cygni]CZT17670.1 related to AMFR protein [Ramularia collo-cygni]
MAQDGQTSINIPQLIAVAVVGFLALRWFMNKPGSPSAPSPAARPVLDINKINQVSAVFPQLDRREIAWDLHRNGGNVSATTERVLGGRGLEAAPPSFRPNIPAAPVAQTAAASTGAKSPSAAHRDLIQRYGLQSRVGGKGKEAVASEEQKKGGWSSDKNARAEALKKRREDMILAARRKMEAKEAQAS